MKSSIIVKTVAVSRAMACVTYALSSVQGLNVACCGCLSLGGYAAVGMAGNQAVRGNHYSGDNNDFSSLLVVTKRRETIDENSENQ